MEYPHWFCDLYPFKGNRDFNVPCAIVLKSEDQARGNVDRYCQKKGISEGHSDLVKYDSLHHLLRSTGYAKEDLIVLSDDDRGKSIAFTYCEEPGGRCGVEYYDGGCFY